MNTIWGCNGFDGVLKPRGSQANGYEAELLTAKCN